MSQGSNSRFGWRLCSALALVALMLASLFLPPQLEQLRSGHWEVEHFFAYLAAVPILFLGWPRPFLVAAVLIPAAVLLEVLQCLRPDHTPNPLAALSSIGGGVSRLPNCRVFDPSSAGPRQTYRLERGAYPCFRDLNWPHYLLPFKQLRCRTTICDARQGFSLPRRG